MKTDMGVSAVRALIFGCVAVALISGCGSSGGTATTLDPPVPDATVSASAPPDTLRLDLSITGGVVQPTNRRLDASVGQKISVSVVSDIADELHVHSVPEHSFEIEPGQAQLFTFTVDVPGQVDMELHDSERTVATLVVRP